MIVPPPLEGEARRRLLQVHQHIGRFWERARPVLAEHMLCTSGCDRCCRPAPRLRGVEAALLLEGARGLGSRALDLVWAALEGPAGACPLLHGGTCLAYDHRPAACRTRGLLLLRSAAGRVVLHHCPRNFADVDPAELPASVYLDEERLRLLLDLVDALYGRQTGWAGGRIGVADLLRSGLVRA